MREKGKEGGDKREEREREREREGERGIRLGLENQAAKDEETGREKEDRGRR